MFKWLKELTNQNFYRFSTLLWKHCPQFDNPAPLFFISKDAKLWLRLLNFQVAEKNVLPSAEDLKQEKLHEGVFKGVEGFTPDKLKPTTTREAASPLDVAKTELARDKTADELKDFDKNKLKQVECQEKNPLPDADSKSCKPQSMQWT